MDKTSHEIGYVYILQSKLNNRYYIGSTINIEKRYSNHKNGFVKSTRSIRPLELKFFKKYKDIKTARQIEYKLKKMKSKSIIDKIITEQDISLTL